MKAKVFFAACLAAVCCSVSAFSSSDVERKYDVGKDFRELNVSGAVDVEYSADADVVTVIADEDVLPYVKVVRRGEELDIYVDYGLRRWRSRDTDVRAVVPASASLETVTVSGASSFKAGTAIKAVNFEVDVMGASSFVADIMAEGKVEMECAGASSVKADVKAENLTAEVVGASDMKISGHVIAADIEVTGASDFVENDGKRLEADIVEVDITGASGAKIHCEKELEGSVVGASSLKYTGSPRSSVRSAGASSVSNR